MNQQNRSYQEAVPTRSVDGPQRVSPVVEELQRLESVQSTTHDLITELEQRLEVILLPPQPNAGGKEDPAPPAASRLHGALQERVATGAGHNVRLAQLIARLTI